MKQIKSLITYCDFALNFLVPALIISSYLSVFGWPTNLVPESHKSCTSIDSPIGCQNFYDPQESVLEMFQNSIQKQSYFHRVLLIVLLTTGLVFIFRKVLHRIDSSDHI